MRDEKRERWNEDKRDEEGGEERKMESINRHLIEISVSRRKKFVCCSTQFPRTNQIDCVQLPNHILSTWTADNFIVQFNRVITDEEKPNFLMDSNEWKKVLNYLRFPLSYKSDSVVWLPSITITTRLQPFVHCVPIDIDWWKGYDKLMSCHFMVFLFFSQTKTLIKVLAMNTFDEQEKWTFEWCVNAKTTHRTTHEETCDCPMMSISIHINQYIDCLTPIMSSWSHPNDN